MTPQNISLLGVASAVASAFLAVTALAFMVMHGNQDRFWWAAGVIFGLWVFSMSVTLWLADRAATAAALKARSPR